PFVWKLPYKRAAATADHEPEKITSRQLTEQSRFAFAALCAVSLGQLFSVSENSAFREQYLQDLVQWLGLDQSVMPVMGAFLSGLGSEGTDTFLSILQADPLVAAGATPIIQVLNFQISQYDARARVLIRHVSCLLRVSPQQLEEFEETLGERLREAGEESEEESSRRQRRERKRKLRRYLLIGLATVGGGTMIGVTGGLAAPLVAAGAGAVLGAGGAAALGSAAGIAIMASLFGAAGAGLTGYKMNKCVGAIEEFEFRPMSSGKHLHLTIAVTGWLCSSYQAPWSSLGECGEQYCLVWESRFLRDLGSAMISLLDGLVSMVAQEALKYTVLSGIVTALTWPASLLAVASIIDNPWCVCLNRSAEVGKHLAQVLRSRQQVGPHLGEFKIAVSVLTFQTKCSEGVVEDVVLLGAPVDGSEKSWERMVKVVAGRIVNGYCRGDWLLGFLYRSSAAQMSVAGLQPINIQDRRIINVDLSSVVSPHAVRIVKRKTYLPMARPSCVIPQLLTGCASTVIQSRLSTWLGRSRGNSIPACSASSRLTPSVAVAAGCAGSEARGEVGLLAMLGSPELCKEMERAGEGLLGDRDEQQGRSLARARLKSLMNSG
uniref:Uncharacterized protein n=1 Tax=Xiphophorus couchianus TaxID=32473 RepID=A0A3B5LIU3_9TELE